MTKTAAILLSLLLSFSSVSLGAQLMCKHVFADRLLMSNDFILADKELSDLILAFNKLVAADTTGLRQEDKYVITDLDVDQALRILEELYNDRFELRDKKVPGRKNVTETLYTLPIKIPSERDLLSAKIRFRIYLTALVEASLSKKNLRVNEALTDRQFVEYKIDHPDLDKVVIKPRMVMLNADIQLFQNRKTFLENRMAILKRTLALPENAKTNPKVIEHFFQIFTHIYAKVEFQKFPLFATTTYARDSYVLTLKNKAGENVEVQITVDREIKIVEREKGTTVRAYDAGHAVVEVKVPTRYSQLTPKDLADVPGLQDVIDLKTFFSKQHIDKYKEGAGKLSTSRKALKKLAQ